MVAGGASIVSDVCYGQYPVVHNCRLCLSLGSGGVSSPGSIRVVIALLLNLKGKKHSQLHDEMDAGAY